MRAYFYVSKCQLPSLFHTRNTGLNAEFYLTQQNVVDRKNVIVKKGCLTSKNIVNIKREMAQQLSAEEQQEIQDDSHNEVQQHQGIQNSNTLDAEQHVGQGVNSDTYKTKQKKNT